MSTVAPADLAQPSRGDAGAKPVVFEDVHLAFPGNEVLRGVSFELERAETKVLFGIAGAGKTTILKLCLGLVKPDRGRIYVLGNDVTSMREEDLFEIRGRIGMVFQESALFDSLTVEENVAFRLLEEGNVALEEVRERVKESLRFVELEHTLSMFPSELSGGMRRRVAIARAIVSRPELLLYDSPTGGLDPVTSTTIVQLIVKQRDVYHSSALMVTHRLQDGFTMATYRFNPQTNRMEKRLGDEDSRTSFLILRDGKVIFDGTGVDLAQTRDEYIREYIS
jgi:phospholipid/cholesterol/gamma-HCH transport system ATP-binding protein